ncbi:MAG TPA: purine-binding chemotaxis protein CheW [Clostridiaceae bacterium]|nr:purine-binding chemotaxis protein CheW [Clostridiaceae bacterium]
MNEIHIVTFQLNNLVFGAEALQVKEIKKYKDVASLPEMPEYIHGIINLRGIEVPVVNLNEKFKLGVSEINKKTKILITQVEDMHIGFAVNDVYEILKFTEEEIDSVPRGLLDKSNSYLKYIAKRGEKLISVVDLSKVLDDREVSEITQLIEQKTA